MDDELITYSKKGNAVVIHRQFRTGFDIVLDEPNLEKAIENIKATRHDYLTESAYQAHLNLYLRAQEFLCQELDALNAKPHSH